MPVASSAKEQELPRQTLNWDVDDDWGDEDDDASKTSNLSSKLGDLELSQDLDQDPNGNPLSPQSSGAVAKSFEEASAVVESDQIQDVIMDPPDAGLNNSAIPALFFGGGQNSSSSEKIVGHFKPLFLAVEEEYSGDSGNDLSDHERHLLLEYKTRESLAECDEDKKGQYGHDGYEEVAPRHGDMGLYNFISAISRNHGHVLR